MDADINIEETPEYNDGWYYGFLDGEGGYEPSVNPKVKQTLPYNIGYLAGYDTGKAKLERYG